MIKIVKSIIKDNAILYAIFKFFLFFLKNARRLVVFFKSHIVQSRYKKLKILKKKVFLSDKKIKVVFFITQKQLWCHQTIYENFLSNIKFEPVVIVFPNEHNKINSKLDSLNDNLIFFKKNNIRHMVGYDKDQGEYISLKQINADIIFYDQPVPRLPKNLLFFNASKHALICYVPYGFKIANFKQAHFNMELQNSSWKVFAESNWHKDQFIKYGSIEGRNVVVSGYPKLDNYLKNSKNLKLNLKKNFIKKVIWAPHWTVNYSSNFSTFDKNYIFFKMIAKKYSDIYWVFKPHQSLRYHLEEIGFMTKKEINEYYEFWEKLPNGEFKNESDYFDVFKNSDALITDCGSFLAEYLPTKKPILHLVNPNSAGFNDIGKELLKSYYNADDNNDIVNFLNDVIINSNDYLKDKRLKNLALVKPNNTGAGKFIVEHINRELS